MHALVCYELPQISPVCILQVGVRDPLCMVAENAAITIVLMASVGCMLDEIINDFTNDLLMMSLKVASIRDVEFIKIPLLLVFLSALSRQIFVA